MRVGQATPPRAARELVGAAVPGLAERMMVRLIRREWAAAAGPELGRRATPIDLENRTLHVETDSSACLQELALRAPDILSALARRFGDAITALRPSLARPAPVPAATAPPGPAARPADLTPDEAERVDRLAGAIADPLVAAAVRRVLVKDHIAQRTRPRRAAGLAGADRRAAARESAPPAAAGENACRPRP